MTGSDLESRFPGGTRTLGGEVLTIKGKMQGTCSYDLPTWEVLVGSEEEGQYEDVC